MRLAVLTSHPIQYYAPLFAELARRIDLLVFFAHRATREQQAAAGFGTAFEWDVELTAGYPHEFLRNVARTPGSGHFSGCDTPDIGERLQAGRYDALLVMGWNLKAYWQGVVAAKRQGVKVLVRGDSHLATPRGALKRALKSTLYPPLLRLFDCALYVGARNRAYYERYRYPTDRLIFSPHCVDGRRFAAGAGACARAAARERLGLQEKDRAALFCGKLVESKRPGDLVAAVGKLRERDQPVHVIVAGSGPLEKDLREQAEALDVPLHLLGFQNQTQMPAAYAAADALVLPSDGRETWGLVCNEALACGVPIVVSSEVGCAPDLAADGKVGRTYPVGDVGALARALEGAFYAPPSRNEILALSERYGVEPAAAGIVEACRRARAADSQRRPLTKKPA